MPEQKKTQVSFGTATMLLVPSAMEMKDDEVNDIWYTSDDYKRMKREDKAILKRLAARVETEDCGRGLENRSTADSMYLQVILMDAIKAVTTEQETQKKAGTNDPERIRQFYETITLEFMHEAMVRGKKDAEAVEKDADIIDMKEALLSVTKAQEELIVHKTKADPESESKLSKFLGKASKKLRRRQV